MKRILFALSLCLLAAPSALAQSAKPLEPADLFKIRRVASPEISPSGDRVAYTLTSYAGEKLARSTHVYVAAVGGGAPRMLGDEASSTSNSRWSPDGKWLAYVSPVDGTPQIWVVDAATLASPRQVTSISTGASSIAWSPDGQTILFTSDVYPDCADDDCNRRRAAEVEANPVKAKIATRLLYRHWNAWKENLRTHVFAVSAAGGPARDLTPGDWDAPPYASGSQDAYAVSPDGKEVVYARNTDEFEAGSTNSDLFLVPLGGGEAKRITGANRGWDGSPLYSPDGRYLAYLSQEREGFEADRFRLMLYDRKSGSARELTAGFDRAVDSFVWAPSSDRIYFVASDETYAPIYQIDVAGGAPRKLYEKTSNGSPSISRDGRTLAFTRTSETMPAEVFVATVGGEARQITTENRDILATRALAPVEELVATSRDGTRVPSLLLKPVGFDPSKRYPLVVLIHGGPQSAWSRSFGYRWNPHVFAGSDYVVLLPNPRGSTGYGQKFTDAVSGDWGGKPYEDVMAAVDAAEKLPYVDSSRVGAAGASYGGYMINWILGHTDRFEALVSHDGIFDTKSMAGVTEELWFSDWEFKGDPWTNPELYEKWSPSNYVKNFKTPTLVVHGELDYRVPVGEGIQLFTALQRMHVPSKLLYFPDEGHWVLKPQNSLLWYETVRGWLDTYLKPTATGSP
jgi:dipeptidyl aminopeptidase/acylaminoacyl peptidase